MFLYLNNQPAVLAVSIMCKLLWELVNGRGKRGEVQAMTEIGEWGWGAREMSRVEMRGQRERERVCL